MSDRIPDQVKAHLEECGYAATKKAIKWSLVSSTTTYPQELADVTGCNVELENGDIVQPNSSQWTQVIRYD